MAILHILSSFFFVDLSNIHDLRLFYDSKAKEIHSCISTPGQYCVIFASRSWTVVNETNQTDPKLVAKIQVYMSNKTQTQSSNYFSLLRKSGWYKNMLNFMAIVYLPMAKILSAKKVEECIGTVRYSAQLEFDGSLV